MMKKLTGLLVAAGLAASLVGSPAMAQTSAVGTMEMGLSMLELAAQRELRRLGMPDVDVTTLSLGQLSSIRLILGSDNLDENAQRQQVRAVLEERAHTVQ